MRRKADCRSESSLELTFRQSKTLQQPRKANCELLSQQSQALVHELIVCLCMRNVCTQLTCEYCELLGRGYGVRQLLTETACEQAIDFQGSVVDCSRIDLEQTVQPLRPEYNSGQFKWAECRKPPRPG